MQDDGKLLAEYARHRSETAFGQLVARHIDLVYATALRVVHGDVHLAQDVTQAVFIHLAREVRRLPREIVLAGWLHRHTSYTASKAVRTEQRRRHREQMAMELRALEEDGESLWEQIAPHLDQALSQLQAQDRDALVLRFLKRQDLRGVGAGLGISDDAAQKRVSRALEKLRVILKRRGTVLSTAVLASALAGQVTTAAPTGLVAMVTTASLAAAAEKAGALTFLKLMATTTLKTSILSGIVLASILVPVAFQHRAKATQRAQDEALRLQAAEVEALEAVNRQLADQVALAQRGDLPTNEPARELLRLRGEVGRLRNEIQDLAEHSPSPAARAEMLASLGTLYSGRAAQLKQWLKANPSEHIPELEFLKEGAWLDLAQEPIPDTEDGYRQAMSAARGEAESLFVTAILHPALQQYAEANEGRFPTDLVQLKPYMEVPVDDAVFQRWEIIPGTNLALVLDEEWVVTQKAPVNKALDKRFFCGLHGLDQNFSGRNKWDIKP